MKNLVLKKIEEMEKIAKEANFKTEKTENVELKVKFNIKSIHMSGQARYWYLLKKAELRFHEGALETYKERFIESTVVHEYAHILTYLNFPQAKPHGREFKFFMALMGANPNRTHSYDLEKCSSNIRKQEKFEYTCDCGYKHTISKTIHNRILNGKKYRCNICKSLLIKK